MAVQLIHLSEQDFPHFLLPLPTEGGAASQDDEPDESKSNKNSDSKHNSNSSNSNNKNSNKKSSLKARRLLAELALSGKGPLQVVRRRSADHVLAPPGQLTDKILGFTDPNSTVTNFKRWFLAAPQTSDASGPGKEAFVKLLRAAGEVGVRGLPCWQRPPGTQSVYFPSSATSSLAKTLEKKGFLDEGKALPPDAPPCFGGCWGGLGVAIGRALAPTNDLATGTSSSSTAPTERPRVWFKQRTDPEPLTSLLFETGFGPFASLSIPCRSAHEQNELASLLGLRQRQDEGSPEWSELAGHGEKFTVLELIFERREKTDEVRNRSERVGFWIFSGPTFLRVTSSAPDLAKGLGDTGEILLGLLSEKPGALRALKGTNVPASDRPTELPTDFRVHASSKIVVVKSKDGWEQHWKIVNQSGEDPFGQEAYQRGEKAEADLVAAEAAAEVQAAQAAAKKLDQKAEKSLVQSGFFQPQISALFAEREDQKVRKPPETEKLAKKAERARKSPSRSRSQSSRRKGKKKPHKPERKDRSPSRHDHKRRRSRERSRSNHKKKREKTGFDARADSKNAGSGFSNAPGVSSLPPRLPSAVHVAVADPQVEFFLAQNSVDANTAARFRAVPPRIQRIVLQRGSLIGTRDPSAVLMSRVRDALQSDGGLPGMPPMSAARSAPTAFTPSNPEVEQFLANNPVDPAAGQRLRALPLPLQRHVLQRGGLAGAREASSVLMSRIKDASVLLNHMQAATPGGQSMMHPTMGQQDWVCTRCGQQNRRDPTRTAQAKCIKCNAGCDPKRMPGSGISI